MKIKQGDVFEIDLFDNGRKGFGRVLIVDRPRVFIELYQYTGFTIFQYEIIKGEIALSIWGMDNSLRNGEWKILFNCPVEGDVKLPVFYRIDDTNPNRLILIDGDKKTLVHKNDKGSAQPSGTFDTEAVRIVLLKSLKEQGLWDGAIQLANQKNTTSIFESDLTYEVKDFYTRNMKRKGADSRDILVKLLKYYEEHLNDEDDADDIYLTLASVQLSLDCLDDEVRLKALDAIDSGRNIERYKDLDIDIYEERIEFLNSLKKRLIL